MKETEQTLLDQIKDQVSQELFKCQFGNLLYSEHEKAFINKICELYATAKAKASCEATLKKASEKAVVRGYCAGCERAGLLHCAHADSCGSNVVIVDKSSINHPSNIVIVP